MADHPNRFKVACCGRRRRYVETCGDGAFRGVLLCDLCDGPLPGGDARLNEVPAKIEKFYP